MLVRFYPSRKREKSNALARFLRAHKVKYELVRTEELKRRGNRLYGGDGEPVVEIDGRIFVNPNEQALEKILDGEAVNS
ncbi:MAG TPA: hypothetical protein VGE86_06895 [Thermoanaerobaculia bacterium]